MPLKLVELTDDDITVDGTYKDLVEAAWEAFLDPNLALLDWQFPQGPGPNAQAERVAASVVRMVKDHQKKGRSSQWIKIVDTETGEIAGGCQWLTFLEPPYGLDDEEIDWWPAGEERDFVTACFMQFLEFRATYMQKPHIHVESCFVVPKYRRQGVGKHIMDYGTRKADKLGLDIHLDATRMGAPLYQKYGFISPPTGWVSVTAPENKNPSARWKELEATLLPLEHLPMWRPANLKIDKDHPVSWEVGN